MIYLRIIVVIGSIPGHCILIRAIDKSLIAPLIPPGIDHNPGTHFIFFLFSSNTVPVQIELNTVIISYNRQGMVYNFSPILYVILIGDSRRVIGVRFRNTLPVSTTGHSDTANTTSLEIRVSIMVPKPILYSLTPFFRSYAHRKISVPTDAVTHGGIPFVVTLHPSKVGIRSILISKKTGISPSTIHGYIRNTIGGSHHLFSGIGIGQ